MPRFVALRCIVCKGLHTHRFYTNFCSECHSSFSPFTSIVPPESQDEDLSDWIEFQREPQTHELCINCYDEPIAKLGLCRLCWLHKADCVELFQ